MNLKKFEGRWSKISATDVLYDNIKPCGSYLFNKTCKDDDINNYETHCIGLDIIEIAAEEV